MTPQAADPSRVAVIGGGPAGLMAAEALAARGIGVDVFDAMPSVGRKFLLAGKGGLNLTHGEAPGRFLARYGDRTTALRAAIDAFDAQAVRRWAADLGIETFVGSSGRVFPHDLKAAPLLRAWLQRLRGQGVRFFMRHRFTGWSDDGAGWRFEAPDGASERRFAAVVLALGGASWARLGSDGRWAAPLASRGVQVAPLRPSNCGFHVAPVWTPFFKERHAGEPLKSVGLAFEEFQQVGECVVTEHGLEGSLVYAASSRLRERIAATGSATFHLDLLPVRSAEWVRDEVARPRGSRSLSTHLKSRLGLQGAKAALLHEWLPKADLQDPVRLAEAIKHLPVTVDATRPLDEAISTAGGVRFEALDDHLQLQALPGVFCAGEMLDWEAPTGGYLLTACMATGRLAGEGVALRLRA